MDRTCIIVADGRSARYFSVKASDSPRHGIQLVEHEALSNPAHAEPGANATGRPPTKTNANREAGPVHPIGAHRERHLLEQDRRFGREIARNAGALAARWKQGCVILIAEPHLLGLTRAGLRDALPSGVELKELARNYAHLSVSELRDRLDLTGIVLDRAQSID